MTSRDRRGWLAGWACLVIGVAVVGVPRRAPATVAEQRARLPPAAACKDPIAGVWRAHTYRSDQGRWALNTMELRWSDDRSKLLSTYENHFWNGGPDDGEPPPCRPGLYRRISTSTGEGTFNAGVLKVRGTKLGPEQDICGHPKFQRALGELEGTLDAEHSEFRSQMTSRFGVYPIVWRRIRCIDEPAAPAPDDAAPQPPVPPSPPVPPPPTPPSSGSGCGCERPGA